MICVPVQVAGILTFSSCFLSPVRAALHSAPRAPYPLQKKPRDVEKRPSPSSPFYSARWIRTWKSPAVEDRNKMWEGSVYIQLFALAISHICLGQVERFISCLTAKSQSAHQVTGYQQESGMTLIFPLFFPHCLSSHSSPLSCPQQKELNIIARCTQTGTH